MLPASNSSSERERMESRKRSSGREGTGKKEVRGQYLGKPSLDKHGRNKQDSGKVKARKPAIAIVGAGSLAAFLAPALAKAGYRISEIIVRKASSERVALRGRGRVFSRGTAGDSVRDSVRLLARKVGARISTMESARLEADGLWFAVPDSQIRGAAESMARNARARGLRFAFHSSGALASSELGQLGKFGVGIASVHPLMTFVAGAKPSLTGVPFAIEGDAAAIRVAQAIVRELGADSFVVATRHKAAYHTWATMTSPLLVAYFVTLEAAAHHAGLERAQARKMSLPILRQTLDNYARLGPESSFSGPFIRGDAETVAKHLAVLERSPETRATYVALAKAALDTLPAKNRKEIKSLLEGSDMPMKGKRERRAKTAR
jgi:predicted short-subunit dehydrogenase-like oxidoreductase (DUF2520 family)